MPEKTARKSTKALNNIEKKLKKQAFFQSSSPKADFGAGNGIRTRDIQLGRLTL
jgi:hypothetical protein